MDWVVMNCKTWQEVMGVPPKQAHIGMATLEQCRMIEEQVKTTFE